MTDTEQSTRCDICGEGADEDVRINFYPIKHEDRAADIYRAVIRIEKVEYGEEDVIPTGEAHVCLSCFLLHCIDKLPRKEARLMYRDGHHAYK